MGIKIYRHDTKAAYYYITNHAAVDADGAPNAYHPDDVGKNCRFDPHLGLDCPANAGFPGTSWWNQVLVPDPDDLTRPFVQKHGDFKGFFVTMTWLTDPTKANTDIQKYVDSRNVQYLVFPGTRYGRLPGTGYKGDVGFAHHLENGKSTSFIVADQGGGINAKLGEASIAFFEALGGRNVNPRTGAGIARGPTRFVMFPGSRSDVDTDWPRTNDNVSRQVDALIQDLGGMAVFENCPN